MIIRNLTNEIVNSGTVCLDSQDVERILITELRRKAIVPADVSPHFAMDEDGVSISWSTTTRIPAKQEQFDA